MKWNGVFCYKGDTTGSKFSVPGAHVGWRCEHQFLNVPPWTLHFEFPMLSHVMSLAQLKFLVLLEWERLYLSRAAALPACCWLREWKRENLWRFLPLPLCSLSLCLVAGHWACCARIELLTCCNFSKAIKGASQKPGQFSCPSHPCFSSNTFLQKC